MSNILNILIVYSSKVYPLRTTVDDHLYAFKKYSEHRCFYVNLSLSKIPWYVKKVHFDVIVFHTTVLAGRLSKSSLMKRAQKMSALKQLDALKIMLPQDEFIRTDELCDFINDFDIDYVFSVAPESEWPKIYHTVDSQKVKFFRILTGYLDDGTIERIQKFQKSMRNRSLDIGYRSWQGAPWLGRRGLLKAQIADVFREESEKFGFVTDISTRREDSFEGDDWYKFLLKCKYTIGVEGGASILDCDGSLKKQTETYLSLHPHAEFQEVEAACFPNLDGTFQLFALSPRHLEACATKTCQVLVEGEYNNILTAGEHFIEVKRDFSNLSDVLEIIKQDEQRNAIVERAYQDIVASGQYTYKSFVEFILEQTHPVLKSCCATNSQKSRTEYFLWYWALCMDKVSWIRVAVNWYFTCLLARILPKKIVSFLSSIRKSIRKK